MKLKVTALILVLLVLGAACGRGLAEQYRAELGETNLELDKLEIVGSESEDQDNSLVIAYRTEAGDDREAFNQEIISLVKPAANKDYQLVDIMIIATNDEGVLTGSVSMEIEDVEEWVQDKINRQEFVSRWKVTGF